MVSGLVLQMGTKNWMLPIENQKKNLLDAPYFYSSWWVSLSVCLRNHGLVFSLFKIVIMENMFNLLCWMQVNASGKFYRVAKMMGPVDLQRRVDYWRQEKWNGQIQIKWNIIKYIFNSQLQHITLENNNNKPMKNNKYIRA